MAEKNPEGYMDSEEILCEKSSVEDEAESCLEKQPTEPRFHSTNSLRRRRRKMNVSRLSRENNGFPLGNDSTDSQISSNCVGSVKDENREVIDVEPVTGGEDEEEKELPCLRDGEKDTCRDETITVADSMPEPSSAGRESSSFVFWLADIVIQAVGFQVWFMLRVLSLPSYLMHQGYHLPSTLLGVKENMSSLIDTVLQVPSHLQPSVGRRIKRIGWGCFLSWYVFWLLLLLILAAFLLGFFVMHTLVEEPVHMKEALYFDYTKPHPVAFVSLQSCSATSNLEDNHSSIKDRYQKNVLPPRLIPANNRLEVAVDLTLPESNYNIKLGIFQVKLEFLSAEGKILGTSSHPCMLRFKSSPIRYAETLLWSTPFLLGFASESQTRHLEMTEFAENIIPTACLRVTLEPRAEFPPGAGIPEIYSAELYLNSELPWLKRMIWNWKWTLVIWLGMGSFAMEVLILLLCCRSIFFPRLHGRELLRGGQNQN